MVSKVTFLEKSELSSRKHQQAIVIYWGAGALIITDVPHRRHTRTVHHHLVHLLCPLPVGKQERSKTHNCSFHGNAISVFFLFEHLQVGLLFLTYLSISILIS